MSCIALSTSSDIKADVVEATKEVSVESTKGALTASKVSTLNTPNP
jgi:hypothetical protein